MALGSTQPLVKMSTRNIPGGKGGRCVRLTTSPPSCAACHENLGAQTSWNPLGHTGPVTGWHYLFIWYQNLSVSLERLWGIAVTLAFDLVHTVKQEGPVSIAETILFFFHIYVGDFCKASDKKLRFQFWYNQQNLFNTSGIYLILTKNILMFWVLYYYFYVKQNYS